MNILFIQTGGTIDKDYPKVTKGYAFEITSPAVERILKDVNPSFDFEINSILKKDSTEITDEDRKNILETCKNSVQDKILITHGTDTMKDTAEALSEIKNKTIVITGSMRPEMFSNTDADFNVGVAVGALNTLDNGVYVAMHGRVIDWRDLDRNMETGQFKSIRD